jgi:hypothetical protein
MFACLLSLDVLARTQDSDEQYQHELTLIERLMGEKE